METRRNARRPPQEPKADGKDQDIDNPFELRGDGSIALRPLKFFSGKNSEGKKSTNKNKSANKENRVEKGSASKKKTETKSKECPPVKRGRIDSNVCRNLFNNPEVGATKIPQVEEKKELLKRPGQLVPSMVKASTSSQPAVHPLFQYVPAKPGTPLVDRFNVRKDRDSVSSTRSSVTDNEFLKWEAHFKSPAPKPKEPAAETAGKTYEERLEEIISIIETDEQEFAKYQETHKQHMTMIVDIINILKKSASENVKAPKEDAGVPDNVFEPVTADKPDLRKSLFVKLMNSKFEEPHTEPPRLKVPEEPKTVDKGEKQLVHVDESGAFTVTVNELMFFQNIASKLLTQAQDAE
ncbi:uncharacterized protein LOC109604726 isoform X2 [Aethina tumida]|uniref:uncharacterized protein LOC109604726 isoform X2 n=1 Tax=Aethina tumida TaxID=116153 RepID=UPI0021488E34|nr:uncharacterized protein LOC109604726 isoform X2 [Aethina tumida]